ncbi:MAG: class B sortase [Mogibacterium sp.]|nr:class B sortase [Mogibacterium sp.]
MASKKKRKVRKAATKVIMVCLIAIFIISGYNVVRILTRYNTDKKAYDGVASKAVQDIVGGVVDFDALKAINPDAIAWLYLEDSRINYPVVKASDNDKYLSTLFDGSWGWAGTLFTDCATDDPFHQFSTIVYGHHMNDKSMFYSLDYYRDPEFAKSHPRFELIMEDGKYHLDVWACVSMASDSDLYKVNIQGDARAPYLEMIKKNAVYMTDVSVGVDDNIVILSTCAYEYENARQIVVCKMVPWD